MKKLLFLFILILFYQQNISAQSQPSTTLASEEVAQTQKVKIFPNPATTVVNVLGLQNSNKAEIIVSDLYGNAVLQHHWEIKNNALNIPISNLESGMYMISIRSQEQNIKTKFLKK
ncbi:MAG: T9SS type A sorting domain-containing protein [Flavobacteriaceae bacterium]